MANDFDDFYIDANVKNISGDIQNTSIVFVNSGMDTQWDLYTVIIFTSILLMGLLAGCYARYSNASQVNSTSPRPFTKVSSSMESGGSRILELAS